MFRQKQPLKTNKKKKKGKAIQTALEIADDFLAVGVDYEEAGEKWRAGDASKSMRFFTRAIETYEGGLRRFPESFDLAYNKARLQYEIAQQPRLMKQLPTSLIELLETALESHYYALKLGQGNADVIFNTAQVLTSTAELLSEGLHVSDEQKEEALRLFQEALELFQGCLDLQEYQFTQAQDQNLLMDELSNQAMEGSTTISSSASEASEDERWASVVEPISRNTLLDTAIAQMETLIVICNLIGPQRNTELSLLEELSRHLLDDKIPSYVENGNRQAEVLLVKANFASAFADSSFRSGHLDMLTYEQELSKAFGQDPSISTSPQGLCDRADALMTFLASVLASLDMASLQPDETNHWHETRWRHLTQALLDLTAASKLPQAQNLPRIHLRRGDCELLRYRLGDGPLPYGAAKKNSVTLLKNAQTYYRGAAGIAVTESSIDEEQEARVKEAVVAMIGGLDENIRGLIKQNECNIGSTIEEMRGEGLLTDQDVSMIGSLRQA